MNIYEQIQLATEKDRRIEKKYNLDDLVSYNVTTIDSKELKGVSKQFVEHVSIRFSYNTEVPYYLANNIYDFITEYVQVDLGDKNLFNEYLRELTKNKIIRT